MRLLPPATSRFVLLVLDDCTGSLVAGLRCAAPAAELVLCPSPEAVAGALASGRPYSALLARRVDRELACVAARTGTPVLTVARDAFPAETAAALAARAVPVRRADQPLRTGPEADAEWSSAARPRPGVLVAVCGPGGTGASTVAGALALAFGSLRVPAAGGRVVGTTRSSSAAGGPFLGIDWTTPSASCSNPSPRGASRRTRVLLADLALRADQAFLHGVDEAESGLLDLLDAGRYRPITAADTRRHSIAMARYRLLPGLRRPGHWTAVSPTAVDTVLGGLIEFFDWVVADITADFEGEADAGSLDVEERNYLARRTVEVANVVVVVGGPGLNGTRRLALAVDDLLDHGVDPARIQPVINRMAAPGSGGERAHICGLPAAPIDLAEYPDAVPPEAVVPLVAALARLLARSPAPPRRQPTLVPVTPGTLGCPTS